VAVARGPCAHAWACGSADMRSVGTSTQERRVTWSSTSRRRSRTRAAWPWPWSGPVAAADVGAAVDHGNADGSVAVAEGDLRAARHGLGSDPEVLSTGARHRRARSRRGRGRRPTRRCAGRR
jgi:hypothetical protein